MVNYSEFYNSGIPFNKVIFVNKHGERFYVLKTKFAPFMYFITGDEYDWELTRLFNPKFDLYDDDEIVNLGKALQELCLK